MLLLIADILFYITVAAFFLTCIFAIASLAFLGLDIDKLSSFFFIAATICGITSMAMAFLGFVLTALNS